MPLGPQLFFIYERWRTVTQTRTKLPNRTCHDVERSGEDSPTPGSLLDPCLCQFHGATLERLSLCPIRKRH